AARPAGDPRGGGGDAGGRRGGGPGVEDRHRRGTVQDRPDRGGGPQGRQGAAGEGVPRDLLLVHRHADLPGDAVRVAFRPRGRARHLPRHTHDHRLHPVLETRGAPRGGGRGSDDGRLLTPRNTDNLRLWSDAPTYVSVTTT